MPYFLFASFGTRRQNHNFHRLRFRRFIPCNPPNRKVTYAILKRTEAFNMQKENLMETVVSVVAPAPVETPRPALPPLPTAPSSTP